jgi:hypothetical protein
MAETNPIVISPANWERYVNAIGVYYAKKMGLFGSAGSWLGFAGLEYVGEAGELGNVIKKVWREGPTEELREQARGELADNYILLTRLARMFDIDLDHAAAAKVEELFQRWPDIPKIPTDMPTLV